MAAPIDLSDKTIAVTGGARGIGRIYCTAVAEAGGRVVVLDLSDEEARAVAESLPGPALGIGCDIADEAAVGSAAARIADAFGSLDGLVNNAALMSTLARRPWDEIPLDEWDRVMAVNLRGPFLCARALVPLMASDAGGSIVNISSNRIFEGTPNRLHYTTSKAGIVGFTRALAREVGKANIRVNCVAPGLTLSSSQIESSSADYLEQLAAGRCLPRHQQPQDLVGPVLFLLSDHSAYVTGQMLNVDGGKMMH